MDEKIFNNKKVCTTKVLDIIISSTFLWFKHRNKKKWCPMAKLDFISISRM